MKNVYLIRVIIFFSIIIFTKTANSNFHPTVVPEKGPLSGVVTDKKTGQPLPDASIILLKTKWGTVSRDGGFYFIENIPSGSYDIAVRMAGYQTENVKDIKIGATTSIDFALQQTAIQIDPVVVTATRSDHVQSKVSVSTEILTEDLIQEKNGNTVGEIVESAGGIYVRDYGSFTGLKTISIRGSDYSQVLVLLDGQRLNSPQDGGVDLNAFPIETIEKIEIIRGGHSALMGTDAIGGAIQLISKEYIPAKGYSYGFHSTLGSFGTQRINLFGSHQLGPIQYFITYHINQSKGNFTYTDPTFNIKKIRKNNGLKEDQFFLKTKLHFGRTGEIRFIHQVLKSGRGCTGSTFWPSPLAHRNEERRLYTLQFHQQLKNRLRLNVQSYLQTLDNMYKNPDPWFPEHDLHKNTSFGFDIQTRFVINSHIIVNSGVESRKDRLNSTKFSVQKRNSKSIFIQPETDQTIDLLGLKTYWKCISAIRWDDYDDIGSHTCPKIGILMNTGENTNLTLRGNIGNSFRVPTFNDLYWPKDSWSMGNPGLAPEYSTNYDFGLVFRRNNPIYFNFELNYFLNKIDNLIIWESDSQYFYSPQNIGRAMVIGIENQWSIRLPKNIFYLQFIYTAMKATDETHNSPFSSNRLIYRPDIKINIQSGFNLYHLYLNLNYEFVGTRASVPDNTNILPDYQLFNGNVGYSFSIMGIMAGVKIQINNILNQTIYLLDGYPLPGREIRFSFGFNY